MKKHFTTILMLAVLAVAIPLTTQSAYGQSRCYNSKTHRYYACKKPNFYRRHRKLVNIGGLLGGKKGAAIGTLAGAGTGYIVTKKQKRKNYIRKY